MPLLGLACLAGASTDAGSAISSGGGRRNLGRVWGWLGIVSGEVRLGFVSIVGRLAWLFSFNVVWDLRGHEAWDDHSESTPHKNTKKAPTRDIDFSGSCLLES